MQVLARVQLEACIDAGIFKRVQNGFPAAGKLGEGFLDETGRPLRPGIDIGPGEGTGEGRMG